MTSNKTKQLNTDILMYLLKQWQQSYQPFHHLIFFPSNNSVTWLYLHVVCLCSNSTDLHAPNMHQSWCVNACHDVSPLFQTLLKHYFGVIHDVTRKFIATLRLHFALWSKKQWIHDTKQLNSNHSCILLFSPRHRKTFKMKSTHNEDLEKDEHVFHFIKAPVSARNWYILSQALMELQRLWSDCAICTVWSESWQFICVSQ